MPGPGAPDRRRPAAGGTLARLLFPAPGRRSLVRIALLVAAAWLFFSHVLLPLRIDGRSMEPSFHDGALTFCNRLAYLFSAPRRFDVVAIRMAGERVVLLKRIVALPGEQVMFRDGRLFVDNTPLDEPHVRPGCDWNMAPRTVAPGKFYVIGDNRAVPMAVHDFGQVDRHRILGRVPW